MIPAQTPTPETHTASVGPTSDVLVLGAGATGLAAARSAARAGGRVTLLEREDDVGGNLRTISEAGWQVEQGPNTVIMKAPLYALLDELGLLDEAIQANPDSRKRYVVLDGQPTALPSRVLGALNNPLLGRQGWAGILREPFVPRGTDSEESLADFVRRRLGPRVLERLVDPFVSGVYAGDPARLSAAAAMPRLVEMERQHGSLIRAQLAGLFRKRPPTARVPKQWRGKLLSFPGGLQRLALALEEAIQAQPGADIACGIDIRRIERLPDGLWQVTDQNQQSWRSRQLISTLPAHASATLLAPLDARLSDRLAEIVYPPVSVIALGFRKTDIDHPLDGFGLLLPRKEGRKTLGALFPSSLFPSRAPDGHHLLNVFLGGRQWPGVSQLSDAEQIAQAIADLQDLLGIRAAPVWQKVIRWPLAIPQYEQGHLTRLAELDGALADHSGLFLAGNWRDGIAVGDCLENGRRLGERAAQL